MMVELTRRAIFGSINTSVSLPVFNSGTHFNGNTGVIVNVSFALNVTFLCSEFSLKTFYFLGKFVTLSAFFRLLIKSRRANHLIYAVDFSSRTLFGLNARRYVF